MPVPDTFLQLHRSQKVRFPSVVAILYDLRGNGMGIVIQTKIIHTKIQKAISKHFQPKIIQ